MAEPKTSHEFPGDLIWQAIDPSKLFPREWELFRHGDLTRFIHDLARRSPFPMELSNVGLSDEGHALHTLRFGTGSRRILVWARQHGDEPDCSAALCAALDYLVSHGGDEWVKFLLAELEILVLPMVNPDGVVRYTRRNAQGLDLNREAVALSGPEAQALITLKHGFDPEYCFNLHDMNGRKSANDTDLVALAFQAGPFEKRDIDNEVRLKAKTICGIMAREAGNHAPKNLARYTADYMPKAFGDSMMRWGVCSILIEAGGWFETDGGDNFVRRLFTHSFLRGLHAIAAGEDAEPTGELYEEIPFDSGERFSDRLLEGGTILNGLGRPPFRADLAVNIDPVVKPSATTIPRVARIVNIGDLELSLAKERLNFSGMTFLPGFIVASPSAEFPGPLPTAKEAQPYLAAGITTVACGFGPFPQKRDREEWLASVRRSTLPINILAFEKVPTFNTIRERHGLTPLCGMLVPNLQVLPEDLLELAHLYHPAHQAVIPQEEADTAIGVDLFFQMGCSPRETRLHLHLTHENVDVKKRKFLPSGELIRFAKEFVETPSQLTFGIDPLESPLATIPLLVSCGGLKDGRDPSPEYFNNVLIHNQGRDESRSVTALNLLQLRGVSPFIRGSLGSINMDARADIAVYPDDAFDLRGNEKVAPRLVLLNGRIAYSRMDGYTPEAVSGALLLAPPHDDA
ncbi:MAG: hypothetical protein JJU11_17540 [Candidatus Sumerlaeia bacterium]|nr:hypothetical protein [Candidatus Sumerlaeia bacterium]